MNCDYSEATGAHNLRPRAQTITTVNQLPSYFPVKKSTKKLVSDKHLVTKKTDDNQHDVSDQSEQGDGETEGNEEVPENASDRDNDNVEVNPQGTPVQGPPGQPGAAPSAYLGVAPPAQPGAAP